MCERGSGAHCRCGFIQQVHGQEPMFHIVMPKNLSHSPKTQTAPPPAADLKHQKPSLTGLIDRAEFRPCLLKVLKISYATCHIAKVTAPVTDTKAGIAHGGEKHQGLCIKNDHLLQVMEGTEAQNRFRFHPSIEPLVF